jgi:Galactose oxidase, central domain
MSRVIRCFAFGVLAFGCLIPGASSAVAQGGQWTWVSGSSTAPATQTTPARGYLPTGYPGQPGIFGTLGVPAAGNVPGAREEATEWADSKGNLWLFGGAGYDANGCFGLLNDLWKFDPSTIQWTWVSGSSTCNQPGIYGTLGQPAAANAPGGKFGAAGWVDSSGNLWLFGGVGDDWQSPPFTFTNVMNDLWEFSPSTNEWTWVAGVNSNGPGSGPSPICGTLGTSAAGNTPAGTSNAGTWTDKNGNFWLQFRSDLWQFSPSTQQWALMAGGCSSGYSLGTPPWGSYGTKGVPAAGNLPSDRGDVSAWTDSSGNFWMLGGQGYDANPNSTSLGILSDLLMYNPSTAEWTWVDGSATFPATNDPVYGTQGTGSTANSPGQVAAANSWTDSSGNFWLFSGPTLWEFNPSALTWTWVGGSNTTWPVTFLSQTWQTGNWPSPGPPGVYGTLGQAGSANMPGARQYGTTWTDPKGNLWLFGGVGYDSTGAVSSLNDLWKYVPPPTFTVAASQPTLTVSSNGQGTVGLMVTSQNGFQAEVSFACSGLPAGASCSFNPATVTPTGGTATTQLTVSVGSQASTQRPGSRRVFPAATLAVAFCLLGIRRRRLQTLLMLMIAAGGLGLLSACASVTTSNSNQTPGTPAPPGPTTSMVTVTATSGSIQQSATISLTVN